MNSLKITTIVLVLSLVFQYQYTTAQISINNDGSSPDASAMLDITSTSKGVLIPRMTTAERTAISSPATGLMVYDADENSFWYYNGSAWSEVGGSSSSNVFTASNGLISSDSIDSDFVIGSTQLDYNGSGGGSAESKLFFDKSKGAFRVGGIIGNSYWNSSYIGDYSFASGYNSKASGAYSFAHGDNSVASGTNAVAFSGGDATASQATAFSSGIASNSYATAFSEGTANNFASTAFSNGIASGSYTTAFSDGIASGEYATAFSGSIASGDYASAFGLGSKAYSYGEVAIGLYNTAYSQNSTSAFNSSDRLFTIGNGTADGSRSDAMIVYKSGNTEINGALTLNNAFTFPTSDGTANQTLVTDGSGTLSWTDTYGYQNLTFADDTLTISEGNSVYIDPSAYYQTLSLSNDTLSLSNGNDIFLNTAFTSDNNLTYANNTDDDFVIGSTQLDYNGGGGSVYEDKLFFDKSKGAFRVGGISGSSFWNSGNIGDYSFASGKDSKASGGNSFAHGYNSFASATGAVAFGGGIASGDYAVAFSDADATNFHATAFSESNASGTYATAFGNSNATADYATAFSLGTANKQYATAFSSATASGEYATAFGKGAKAYSYGEVAIGLYNTAYSQNSTSAFNSSDRLFTIGNGTADGSRSDAMIVYKSGDVEMNGALTLNNAFTFPTTDGAANQTLITDGSGTLSWTYPSGYQNLTFADDTLTISNGNAIFLNSPFTSDNGLTYSNNNSDDFVFGADSLNYDNSGGEFKLYFHKTTGSFRVGNITNNNWDTDSIGLGSFATGKNTLASSIYSAAFGNGTSATAFNTIAAGNGSSANANVSMAFGKNVNAESFSEFAVGMYNTDYTPNSTTAFDSNDRLFVVGNGEDESNRSDALLIYKSGNTEINGGLYVNNPDGTNYFELDSGRINIQNTGGAVFIGDGVGENNPFTSNSYNIAIGKDALNAVSNAAFNHNIAIGAFAGAQHTYSTSNIFLGSYAGYSLTSGSSNFFLGYQTGKYMTSGFNNVIIGNEAASNATTLEQNTFVGHQAGNALSQGTGNVFIGYNSGGTDSSVDDKLYIENSDSDSPLIWGNFTSNRVVINGNNTHNTNNRTLFVNGAAGGTTAWQNDSDRRLKYDIQTIPNALDKVLEMRGVTYKWKDGRETGDRMGFIAQEVEPILPEVVDNNNDHYAMQYAPITAVLIEAVKEQQTQIETLKAENETLKAQVLQINELKAQLELIQVQLNNQ